MLEKPNGAPTRDLLIRADQLRLGIEYRRGALVKGQPAIEAER